MFLLTEMTIHDKNAENEIFRTSDETSVIGEIKMLGITAETREKGAPHAWIAGIHSLTGHSVNYLRQYKTGTH